MCRVCVPEDGDEDDDDDGDDEDDDRHHHQQHQHFNIWQRIKNIGLETGLGGHFTI